MRRSAALGFLLLLLLVPPADAKGTCPAQDPCRIDVTAAAGALTVEPASAAGLGSYRFFVHNAGPAPLNVTIDGQLVIPVAANQTNATLVLTFVRSADLVLREDAGGATATLRIADATVEPGEWSKSATLLSVVLPVLVGFVLVGLAFVVLRHGSVHRHNQAFAAYYLLSGIKSFSEGIDGVADGFHADAPLFPATTFWELMGSFCALMMLPTLLLFLASFPRPLPALARRPLLGLVVFVPSLIMGALVVAALVGAIGDETHAAAEGAFNVYGSLLTILVVVHILRATRSQERIERTQARYVVAGFLPAFAMGWVITGIALLPGYGALDATTAAVWITDIVHFVSPLLELLFAGAVAFAILRYNILGISPKFRVGVKSFLVGFIFVVVFLLTQFVENVVLQGQLFAFAGPYGSFILSGVSGIVLFKPIEKVSGKAADRLVPKPKEDDALSRAAEVYRAQCMYVLRDAQVSPRELDFLRNLRGQLGLSEAQARSIEESVERTLKVDAPQTGASAGTATAYIAEAALDQDEAPEVRRATPLPGPAAPPAAAPARPKAQATPKKAPPKATAPGKAAKAAGKAAAKPVPKKAARPAGAKAAPKRR